MQNRNKWTWSIFTIESTSIPIAFPFPTMNPCTPRTIMSLPHTMQRCMPRAHDLKAPVVVIFISTPCQFRDRPLTNPSASCIAIALVVHLTTSAWFVLSLHSAHNLYVHIWNDNTPCGRLFLVQIHCSNHHQWCSWSFYYGTVSLIHFQTTVHLGTCN